MLPEKHFTSASYSSLLPGQAEKSNVLGVECWAVFATLRVLWVTQLDVTSEFSVRVYCTCKIIGENLQLNRDSIKQQTLQAL